MAGGRRRPAAVHSVRAPPLAQAAPSLVRMHPAVLNRSLQSLKGPAAPTEGLAPHKLSTDNMRLLIVALLALM